jgi:hypothetical protein
MLMYSLGLFTPKKSIDNESTFVSYTSDERHAPDNISVTSATSVNLVHSPRHTAVSHSLLHAFVSIKNAVG